MLRIACLIPLLATLACSSSSSEGSATGGASGSGGSSGNSGTSGSAGSSGGSAGSVGAECGNADFEARAARSDCVFSYSLRDQAQIDQYRHGQGGASAPSYDAAEDACRFTLPADVASSQQVWLPVYLAEKGQTVIVWEHKFSSNWIKDNGLGVHKFVQVRRNKSDGAIWLEPQAAYLDPIDGFDPAKRVRHSRVRPYAALGPGAQPGPFDVTDAEFGTFSYDSDAMGPVLSNYLVPNEVWVRGLLVIEQKAGDPWAYISYAMSDETHDPTLILDQVPLALPDEAGVAGEGRPLHFDFEINTSATRSGPEVWMWGRNVSVHRGVADPLSLLRRPC